MKKALYVIGAVALGLGLGGLALQSKHQPRTTAVDPTWTRHEKNAETAEQLDSAISSSVQAVTSGHDPASAKPEPSRPQPNLTGTEGLAEYVKLKSQIFMNAEMRARKNELLHDEKFLKSLEALLKAPAMNDLATQELQSQAIDLLIEARTVTDSQVAGDVLKSVVEDASIENDNLQLADRKALAGLKAELLYQWTAQEPKVADSILRWLPGPISQKIWRNVLAAQEQNEQASTQELHPTDDTH